MFSFPCLLCDKCRIIFVTYPARLFLKKLNIKNVYYITTIITQVTHVHSNSFLVVPTPSSQVSLYIVCFSF